MANWYCCNLGDALLASVQQERIRLAFNAHYTATSASAADISETPAALFARHHSEGRLHCELLLYFSPAAKALAKQWAARPCRRPAPDNLGLLAGPATTWTQLFPPTPPESSGHPGETP